MKQLATLTLLTIVLFTSQMGKAQTIMTSQISSNSDDSEEQGSNGSSPGIIDIGSSDLELVEDGGDGNQYVGMRFTNINIPQGAFIASAHIQFTVDETNTDSTSVWFKVEDAASGPAFTSTAFDLSSRAVMPDSVLWENIPAWNTVGAAGNDQLSPDLSLLVQMIVDQGGWASGNAINFLVTGVGHRTAESHDGSSGEAPILIIEYNIPQVLSFQVANGNDDAEEQGPNGSAPGTMDITSSDLELVEDGGDGNQFVGIRFNGVNIPQGALIAYANIQFTVDEFEPDSTSVWITVEDDVNPATYGTAAFNISTRSTINDSVLWENIPQWPTAGVAGSDQRTPNLVSLVQYLVDQGGWNAGNAMNFIITGIGQRTAESYDGSSGDAPVLTIGYVPQVPPLGGFPMDSGAVWAYHDSGFALPASWIDSTFNDSAWAFGPAQLGYGDGDESTTLSFGPSATNKYPTYYFRQRFEVENAAQWDSIRYFIKRDDGAVVYLNGQEVFRTNMPTGSIGYATMASSNVSGSQENAWIEFVADNDLVEGVNTITVEVHQDAVTSSDLTFDFMMEGKLPPAPIDTFPLAANGTWYYLDDGSNQDTAWREFSFDPYTEGWAYGDAEFGYGDGDEITVVSYGPNAGNKYITTYFYKEFYLDTAGWGDSLLLGLLRDDAAAVYLNGELVVLDNMPSTYDYTTWSSAIVDGAAESTFYEFHIAKSMFNNGLNSIAVEIHQRDGTSSDVSFNMFLDIIPEPPVAGSGCTNGVLNHIGCFTSIDAIGQTPFLVIPESHAFQVIFQQGDAYDNFAGVAPGNNDFTGFVPINGSSTQGYVDINHETSPGGVTVLDVHYDATNRVWITDSINRVDIYNNALQTTERNCSGGVTPWGTSITSEETYNGGDANGDGYTDVGWNVEIDPATRQVVGQTKLWALGRMAHENVVVANDSITVYEGEDGGSSCVFKFIADAPADLSAGTLYVLKLNDPLSGGDPTGTTGQWIVVPNTTQSDRNMTRSLAISLGGTAFNGVEDCEISPVDGKIYFTAKGLNRIYRFTDNGSTVSDFETFAGGTSYDINIGGSIITEAWGSGNDNLAFDDLGNLWVNQDGSQNYTWMIRPDHSQSNPKVELFGSTPSGAEPTGATFTPDGKFMFMSIQHPSGSNGTFQDVTGNTFAFNKSSTVVIARKEYLGQYGPASQAQAAETENPAECETVELHWTAGDGDRRMVVAREGSAVNASPLDGMIYNADAVFGNGDDLGNGNYVIYDGIGTSMTVQGLDDQAEYHFGVIEYNEGFGSTFYSENSPATVAFEFDAVASDVIAGPDSVDHGELEIYGVNGTAGYVYNWSATGGAILSGQTTPSIAVEWYDLGTQMVSVTQTTEQGCEGEAIAFAIVVMDTTSIVDTTDSTTGMFTEVVDVQYTIYPNPTSGRTVVTFEDGVNAEVELFNLAGSKVNVVYIREGQNIIFDAANLSRGVYFLRMTMESGMQRSHQIIVN